MNQVKETSSDFQPPDEKRFRQRGSSLVEVTIAMVIFLIALLGVFITFTYAVNYNAGNNSRAQALAVLQQEVEQLRSAKFTSGGTDASLSGGKKARRITTLAGGGRFRIDITVDDDPSPTAPGVQTDSTKTIKEIKVEVALDNPTPGWQTSVPSVVFLRRVRGN